MHHRMPTPVTSMNSRRAGILSNAMGEKQQNRGMYVAHIPFPNADPEGVKAEDGKLHRGLRRCHGSPKTGSSLLCQAMHFSKHAVQYFPLLLSNLGGKVQSYRVRGGKGARPGLPGHPWTLLQSNERETGYNVMYTGRREIGTQTHALGSEASDNDTPQIDTICMPGLELGPRFPDRMEVGARKVGPPDTKH